MRLFTVDEVNALIPRMEFLMEQMQRCAVDLRREMDELAAQTGKGVEQLTAGEMSELRPGCRPILENLERLMKEIAACGGEFKGLEIGLVDFPTEIGDEVGLLCWQFGEKEVAHWHTMTGGFAGRRPLPSALRREYLQ